MYKHTVFGIASERARETEWQRENELKTVFGTLFGIDTQYTYVFL